MNQLPPDRSQLLTEQSAGDAPLHQFSADELVAHIQAADAQLPQALAAAAPAIAAFIRAIEPGFVRGGRLIYLGAGTSGRLGVLDASEAPPTFQLPEGRIIGIIAGGDGSLRRSSEGKEDDPHGALAELRALKLGPDDSVLGIAAGGTTPYVSGALAWAAALPQPPVCGLLSCTTAPPPAGVQHHLCVLTGPEVLTGSTRMKAGTATKQVLNTISTSLMIRSGRVYRNLMVALRASNHKLRDRAARIIAQVVPCDREQAFAHLDTCHGDVRAAIVCARRNCSPDQAQQLLQQADGRLERVIDGNSGD
ncbi:MAG: N-acetylmuramic acid 6-phosphate etherase [Planctomycetota bacterium]|nr:MAG: N-acetylmuramic acid 6-phosphate etherase [Planctomycetota bacterium]